MKLHSAIFAKFKPTILLFLAISAIAISIRPEAWLRLMGSEPLFYDVGNYIAIANNGYEASHQSVFSPLWPGILGAFRFLGVSADWLVLVSSVVALLLYLISFRVFLDLVQKVFPKEIQKPLAAIYLVSPFAVFRMIGYSEAICCLFGCLFLQDIVLEKPSWRTLVLSYLLCVARPFQIFFFFSAIGAFVLAFFSDRSSTSKVFKQSLAIVGGSVAAFVTTGFYFFWKFGDFLAPFHGQAVWGRKIGFYPEIFLKPMTVGGSDDVLAWELFCMYGSFLMLGFFVWSIFRKRASPQIESTQFATSFSLLVSVGLVCASIFTYPRFMSLGRHVLGVPFFYFALGGICPSRSPVHRKVVLALKAFAWISFAYYVRFWLRFGKGSWIG